MTTSAEQRTFNLTMLRCAAGTDVGMRRDENQDAFGVVRHESFQGFFVADGMGGVKGGAIASRLAISTLEESLPAMGSAMSPNSLAELVATINTRVFEQGTAQPGLAGMGTTLVGLVFTPDGMISVNVGDSRAYRVRGNEIKQISEDHTVVRELVRSGAISSQEAQHHPVSHMLTRSIGPLAEVMIECRREPDDPQEGDVYVLCSDGLYNLVTDNDILDVVRQNPLDDANQILINLANRRGGGDNITVIVISVGEMGGRRRAADYRTTRGATSVEVVGDAGRITTESSQSGVKAVAGILSEESKSIIPPRVEEPKDYHAERESLKERKRRPQHQTKRVPLTLMVSGAVLFGLVVGDVARRWGGFPDFIGIFDTGSMSSLLRSDSRSTAAKLEELTRELALSRSQGRSREALPEIARRVTGSQAVPSRSRAKGARQDLLSLNRAALERAADEIEVQLKVLGVPVADGASVITQRAQMQVDKYDRELKDVTSQIDTASRKISLWFGRQEKAEEAGQDFFQPGGDVEKVGAISDRVKRKAAEWTENSYQLQAKQDEFELYPNNDSLRIEVEQWRSSRAEIQEELRAEVIKAIKDVLTDTNRQHEELKARREIIAGLLSRDQEQLESFRIAGNPDASARQFHRERLQNELAEIRGAINEIRGGQ